MKVVALLPMKLHSSRVPNKNFRNMCGKPLYRWILDELLALEFVERVVINTDAEELLARSGLPDSSRVIVKSRPMQIRGDDVSMNLVLEDDLNDFPSDCYLMTHTTNPLLTSATINLAYQEYRNHLLQGGDSLFSVNRFQARFYRADASPINHDPNNLIPTQNLEPWFEENSCLYFFTAGSFAVTNARIGATPKLFETPKMESADIDVQSDWNMAEALIRARILNK